METRRVGVLTQSSETFPVELHLKRPAAIGPLTAFADWRPRSGPQLLILIPMGRPAPEVKKAGRRQAGAFLLEPGESFSLKTVDGREETYTFTADPVIALTPEGQSVCGFCRAALPPDAPAFALALGRPGPCGRLLCRDCAAAWQAQAGTD